MPRRKYGKSAYKPLPQFHRFSKGDSYGIKALKIANNLKRALNVEYKHADSNSTGATTGVSATVANGQMILLNNVAQGDGGSSRDGNQYKLTNINTKISIVGAPAANSGLVRIVMFVFRGPNGAAPLQTDLFDNNGNLHVHDFRNLEQVPRFRILHDRVYTLEKEAAGYNFKKSISINKDVDLKVKYNGTTGAYTDIATNSVWLMIISDSVSLYPTFFQNTRCRFVDN